MEEKGLTKEFLRLALDTVKKFPHGKWPQDIVFFLQQYCPPDLDLADPQSLPIIIEILERLLINPQEVPVENIPPNLEEIKAIYEAHLVEEETRIKEETPYWDFYEMIRDFLARETRLYPWEARSDALQATKEIVKELPQIAHPQAFEKSVSLEEYQAILQKVMEKVLPSEIRLPPEKIKDLTKRSQPLAAKLAAIPRTIPTPPPSSPAISEEIPPSVATKIASENQGVAFKPVFTLLYPPTAVSAVKKIVFSPVIKPLQWTVKITERALPEKINDLQAKIQRLEELEGPKEKILELRKELGRFQEQEKALPLLKLAILEGLTSEDVQKSIEAFQKAGLPTSHPKITQLENLQKDLSNFESFHRLLSSLLRHYHEFSKKTSSRQIQEPQTGLLLPKLSPQPVWHQQKGYAWNLRESLNRLGSFLRTHQWIPTPSGRKVIRFVLSDKIIRLITFGKFQTLATLKTVAYQKLIQPVLIWFGKKALGKTIKNLSLKLTSYLAKKGIKEGVKKLVSWVAVKGALAAIPEPVISKILLVLSFIKDIIWGGLKFLIRKFKEKPESAIAAGVIMISLPILIPMVHFLSLLLTVIGIITAGFGLLAKGGAFLAGLIGKTSSLLIGAATKLSNLLSLLPSISLPSGLLTTGVLGSIGATTAISLFTAVVAGSAFFQQKKPSRYVGALPPSVISSKCVDLITLITNIAQDHCIPPAILMAISRMEASGVWSWTCEEIERFSQPKWWETATEAEKKKGYCYDTCAATGLCSGTTVMGPMQFEENTWKAYMPEYTPEDRCRLDLSLIAAAKKIRANANSKTPQTNCGPWNEETVRYVAYRYCGSCGVAGCKLNPNPNDSCSKACGYDYCSNVWYLYQQYEDKY